MNTPQALASAIRTQTTAHIAELAGLLFRSPEEENSCCRVPLDASRLRKIFHTLTRIHFSHAGNFGDLQDRLGCLTYDPDPAASKLPILIHDRPQGNDSPNVAVLVSLQDIKFTKLVMGNIASEHPDGAGIDTLKKASTAAVWRFRHTDPDTACLMGQTMADFLMMTQESMGRKIGLLEMEITSLTAPKHIEKKPAETFEVLLVLQFSYNYSLSIREESHVLTRFSLDLRPA